MWQQGAWLRERERGGREWADGEIALLSSSPGADLPRPSPRRPRFRRPCGLLAFNGNAVYVG